MSALRGWYLVFYGAYVMFAIIAETIPPIDGVGDVKSLIVNIGTLGVLAWYMYQNERIGRPQDRKDLLAVIERRDMETIKQFGECVKSIDALAKSIGELASSVTSVVQEELQYRRLERRQEDDTGRGHGIPGER